MLKNYKTNMYSLFKKIFRKQLEAELRGILGYHEFVGTEDTFGNKQSMLWTVFIREFLGEK